MRRVLALAAAFSSLAAGCVHAPRGWDAAPLAARLPDDAAREALAWTLPVPAVRAAASGGLELALLLCRWPDGEPIPVSLPANASAAELAVLREALALWEATLGLRFVPVAGAAALEVRFPARLARAARSTLGDTVSECATGLSPPVLIAGSVHLGRTLLESDGRTRVLSEDEQLGLALHELGHALGYAGHPGVGVRSILTTDARSLRKRARVARASGRVEAPGVRALYALPSGTVVGTRALSAAAATRYAEVEAIAAEHGASGPFARSGERSARIGWRDAAGESTVLRVDAWPDRLERGAAIEWSEPPRARLGPAPRSAAGSRPP